MSAARWSVVVPTLGRPQLGRMLASLAHAAGSTPALVVLADDRPGARDAPLVAESVPLSLPFPVRVVRTGGRGPAAARNAGWRHVTTPWVVFLDDDVVLPSAWATMLAYDLAGVRELDGASYGRLRVPTPPRPTDWERNTAGLERARWATADAAVRHEALDDVDGFDERFVRAYREDADLALRLRTAGWRLTMGSRRTLHPVRPARGGVSVRTQAGARDDALLRVLHGPRWREATQVGRGRFDQHVATVAAGLTALGAAAAGRRRAATAAALGWGLLTADFLARRLGPGPRPGDEGWASEWARMAWTTPVIPPAAVTERLLGALAASRDHRPWRPAARAVLFDRDGTLIRDVPYNGDPALVVPVPGARSALDALRAAGLRVGLVTNQSGVARGLVGPEDVAAVNARVEQLLGPFGAVAVCPHGPEDRCACRKPEPGLVVAAARTLGLAPWECVVVGDTGADVDAGLAAGARTVLVPTPATLPDEVAQARMVAADLSAAVALARHLDAAPAVSP